MHRAMRAERAGHWPQDRAEGVATLAYDDRHRRRVRLATDGGEEFLLDLPHALSLEDGDGLQLDDGRWIGIRAATESLIEVTAEATLLTRLAWHLGNRHLPARIEPRRILIRSDLVIADMLSKLGATLRFIDAPFTPERGAYDHAHTHTHEPAHAARIMTTSETALYRLMTWLSPAYPVGAFSYSHGLEYAVEARLVHDRESLIRWLTTVVEAGAGHIGGALLAGAWRAAAENNADRLEEIAALAAAWRNTSETALESEAQGAAFLSVTRTAWPHALLDRLAPDRRGGPIALSVAVGATCACHGIALVPALIAYLHGFSSNLISAGIRLIPLGQSDGQLAMAALEPVIERHARVCAEIPLDEIGSAAPILDWCSMRHELQYTRLFRS